MKLKVDSEIDITPKELAEKMHIEDVGELLAAVAARLEGDFVNRPYCIQQFEKTMTEDGAMFLAEIVTQRYTKKK